MDKDDILKYLNRYVNFVLKSSGYAYTGEIIYISKNSFTLIDKYKTKITFDISDISFIKEVDKNL